MKHRRFLLLCLVVKLRLLLAQQQLRFQDFSPPAFHAGAVNSGTSNDVDYMNLNLREFDAMTVSVVMGYGRWPGPNAAIDTADFKELVDSYKATNKLVHGEVLVYPNLNLDIDWWVSQSNSLVESRMYKYIDTMVGLRKGKIWAWDVVNEAMADDYNYMDADGVRTVFYTGAPIKEYEAMGQSFIAKAFHRAHAADPSALLLLADYSCEEDDPSNNNEKSDRMFRFMKKLKSQKVPIHGVGLQFHVSSIPGSEPNYTRIVLNFQRFRNAGFSIFITELDVRMYNTTKLVTVPTAAMKQAAVRQSLVYSRILKICLNEPACKSFLMWENADYNSNDPSQTFSWLQPWENIYWYPSPFWDINPNKFSAKPAWSAMKSVMANFTLVYHVTSLLNPGTGYLGRNGTSTNPPFQLRLYPLNSQTSSLTSLKWRFERVEVGIYRIRCTWGPSTGYLTRAGEWNPQTSEADPAKVVHVQQLQPDWWSQQWYVTPVFGNQYRITNRWGKNGTLTRLQSKQNGNIVAANQVNLAAANNKLSSQIWRLERVWSAGNTKTAADRFWL